MILRRQAFSLIELSIVLVILGLLTGGIIAGQSLIRAAELRAVGTEYTRYLTAIHTFRDKYFAPPGDYRDATRFWGRLNSNGACITNSSATVMAPGACDGNGDGITNYGTGGQSGEYAQLWRHLALAGLIEGDYSGMTPSSAIWGCATSGVDCPKSKLSSAVWIAYSYMGTHPGDSASFGGLNYGNAFEFGNNGATFAILKPEEAWNIDTKLDDGRPTSGKVIAIYWNNACTAPDTGTTTATNLAASYRLSDNTIKCALHFRQLF